jgi:hypothetical protein
MLGARHGHVFSAMPTLLATIRALPNQWKKPLDTAASHDYESSALSGRAISMRQYPFTQHRS